MKITTLSLAILLACSLPASADFTPDPPEDPFAELDEAIEAFENEGSEDEMQEFEAWKSDYLAEYQAFRKEHFQKVDDIRDNLISLWGESEVSSQAQYVEYSEDKSTKTVVDFEKNEIRVSVLHDKNEIVSKTTVADALKHVANKTDDDENRATNSDVLEQILGETVNESIVNELISNANEVEKPAAIAKDEQKVVEKEIKLIEEQSQAQKSQVEKIYDIVNAENQNDKPVDDVATEKSIAEQKAQIEKEKLQRIAALQAQTAKLKSNAKQRDELTNKKITTFTMPLAHKKDLTKAKPFISSVKSQSDRWELSPSLMLAIMHTESYFNPKAQSHVPAFGLMQIVPRTAGIDVNRFLFKKDKPMPESYLFIPEQNIEAGVAYMHILNSRYLRKIENPESRMYCMIAAYNTGSGNVAKTFNKDRSRNINKAAPVINALTPQEVYEHLLANLPYDETRHYVKRVVNRKKIYVPIESI